MRHDLSRWVVFRSRFGNWCLLTISVLIGLAALALFGYSLAESWGYAGLIDHLIWIALVAEVLIATAFAVAAWRALQPDQSSASSETQSHHA